MHRIASQSIVIESLWKPWLRDAILLSIFSGRRAAEIFHLRFSSITEEKEEMTFIKSEDIKVNKIKNLQGDSKKYVSIPITAEMKKLLLKLGYDENKKTEKYIIADSEKMKRDTMARHLWRAFGHYAKQIGINKTFKSLRKTHASALAARIGAENARIITGHSALKVLEDHYFDKKVIGKVAQDFSVFGKAS
ncbi:MAG: tyrosine-type recombinase/integrase [Bacteroidetes bacterium]|nr:tyrosine-type recombinase/integrase [Bacteroidota bacterium]